MRIISKFRDFYDSIQRQGQDRSLIYLREPKEVESNDSPFPFTDVLRTWGTDIVERVMIVGFCGRIMPVLRIGCPRDEKVKPIFAYKVEEIDAFVKRHFKSLSVERYYAAKSRGYWSERWRYTPHRKFVEFFQAAKAHAGAYAQWFQDQRSPIFLGQRRQGKYIVTYNARLEDVEFYRQVDPYTAFQEIQMFLGAMASPEKPIPKIDDKTMAEAKGFDKFSFRKPKQK
ncbi:MAG: hypothetical protein ABFC88_12510 [Thermoguttaceae bacterium]